MTPPKLIDRRANLPQASPPDTWPPMAQVHGVAIHHSATDDGSAESLFRYQVETLGWTHGGYHYVILQTGEIEYALDEAYAAFHASINDPADALGLDYGQYWNRHYLAICLVGNFNQSRPAQAQMSSLRALIQHLQTRHGILAENIQGLRELRGIYSQSPGLLFDMARLRRRLAQKTASRLSQPQLPLKPHDHVLVLPDSEAYLTAALGYIWKFQPDVSFAPPSLSKAWPYISLVGPVDPQWRDFAQAQGRFVQHITGSAEAVQQQLDALVRQNQPFLPQPASTPSARTNFRQYTVQAGDTLASIAERFYGKPNRWPDIYRANQDTLTDPHQLIAGTHLIIPQGKAR